MDNYLSKKFEEMRFAFTQREIKIPPRYDFPPAAINCRCISKEIEEEVVIDYNKIYKILKKRKENEI